MARKFFLILFSLALLLTFSPIASSEVQTATQLKDFSACKISSTKPKWNTVGFPIENMDNGQRIKRLPFKGKIQTLVVPIDFTNYPGKTNIGEYFKDFLSEMNDYYKWVSYGAVEFEFTILPEYVRINRNAEDYELGDWAKGRYETYFEEGLREAAKKFNIGGYDVAYVIASPETDWRALTPGPAFNPPTSIGSAIIPKGSAAGSFRPENSPFRWITHETGHLFGFVDLYHVQDAYQGQNANIHQYFGWWDIMSMNWSTFSLELNAWFRLQAGWLPGESASCITPDFTEIKEITINPLSNKDSNRAIVVRLGTEKALVAEYRTQTRFDLINADSKLSGLLVYSVDGSRPADEAPMSIIRKANLINTSPPLSDAALQVGELIEKEGIVIGVTEKTDEYMKVLVGKSLNRSDIEARLFEKLAERAALKRKILQEAISNEPQVETAPKSKVGVDSAPIIKSGSVKSSLKQQTIKCLKGKVAKKVTGTNPKCPVGYKKV